MTTIMLMANDQELSVVQQPVLASGDVNSVILHVDFSSEWDGYGKEAVFFTEKDGTAYKIILSEGECIIPHEVLTEACNLYIGIRGYSEEGTTVKTSTLVKYKIKAGAPVGKAESVEPTPSQFVQLVSAQGILEARFSNLLLDNTARLKSYRLGTLIVKNRRITQLAPEEWGYDVSIGYDFINLEQFMSGDKKIVGVTVATSSETVSTDEDVLNLKQSVPSNLSYYFSSSGMFGLRVVYPEKVANYVHFNICYAYDDDTEISEVKDIRVGYDGKKYGSAGDAVRAQITALKEEQTDYDVTEILKDVNQLSKEIDKLKENGTGVELTPEQISEVVSSWLDEHPEATTTVQDGSVEERHLHKNLIDKIMFGGIEPETDDIPKVFFSEAIPQTKDDVTTAFRYISKTQDISGYAEFKAQGNSSMSYPKKNMTVKMYSDEALTEKLKVDFKEWGKQAKHVYKANWIDLTHARNIVSARLWADVVKSRENYLELPELLRTSPNQGAVDGFPVKVYSQGIYQGRYTLNIPKDAWMANMDDALDNHCILCGENYVSGCFRATASINGSDWSDEVHDTVPASIRTRWNEVISFVMNSTDEEFVANLENYFFVDSLIDYYIFGLVSCGLDAFGKNQLYFTYDGMKWIASMYDMDSTWGLYWNGSSILASNYARTSYEDYVHTSGNLLYVRLEQLFYERIKARYAELKNGALSVSSIINHFERFTDIVSLDLVKEDYASTTANGAFTGIPSRSTNNIQQIRKFVVDRYAYCDEYIAGGTSSEPTPDPDEPDTPDVPDEPELPLTPAEPSGIAWTETSTYQINIYTGGVIAGNDFVSELYPLEDGYVYEIKQPSGGSWLGYAVYNTDGTCRFADLGISENRDCYVDGINNAYIRMCICPDAQNTLDLGTIIPTKTDRSFTHRNYTVNPSDGSLAYGGWSRITPQKIPVIGGEIYELFTTGTHTRLAWFEYAEDGSYLGYKESNDVTTEVLSSLSLNTAYVILSISNGNNDSDITFAKTDVVRKWSKCTYKADITSGKIVGKGDDYITLEKIPVIGGEIYKLSTTGTHTWLKWLEYAEDGSYLGYKGNIMDAKELKATVSPNATHVILSMSHGEADVDNYATFVKTADDESSPDVPEEVILTSISATYTGGEVLVGTALTDLTGITVTANYLDGSTANVTGYTLSGTIAEGNNTIKVSYGGKTTTVSVIGFAVPEGELYILPQPTTFNGTSDYIDTGVKLYYGDKDFAIMLEFERGEIINTSGTLLHCMYEAHPWQGLTIKHNTQATHKPLLLTAIGSNTVENTVPENGVTRLVLEKISGYFVAKVMHDGLAEPSLVAEGTVGYISHDGNLLLGAYQELNGTKGRYWNGTISQCKVYVGDLPSDEETNAFLMGA